jgi:surfactin synthase thioesterase subunit
MKIIAFPFAGGSSFSYVKLSRILPAGISMITLDTPGHGGRIGEPLVADVDGMARDLAPRVISQATQSPYMLFGHSLGAYLALAVLDRILELEGPIPTCLVLSGAAPPQRHQINKKSTLPREQFFQKIFAIGGMPAEFLAESSLLDLFEPLLRSDFEAAESYTNARRRTHTVPVRILRGTEDTVTSKAAGSWDVCFASKPDVIDFPGSHFFLFERAEAVVAAIASTEYPA